MKQHTTACDECAFRRTIKPGFLGGSPPGTYVGQVNGPFWIPCHCPKNYDQQMLQKASDPKRVVDEHAECAGAAIFRANLGTQEHYPEHLFNALPADHENVFSSYAEFMAHHMRVSVEKANELLELVTPDDWTMLEMRKNEVRLIDRLKVEADENPG